MTPPPPKTVIPTPTESSDDSPPPRKKRKSSPKSFILSNEDVLRTIATDETISFAETKVAMTILSFRNPRTARCFPARRTLAKLLNISHQRVSIIIKNLVKKHVIVHVRTIKPGTNMMGPSQFFFTHDFKKMLLNRRFYAATVQDDILCAALKIKPSPVAKLKTQ